MLHGKTAGILSLLLVLSRPVAGLELREGPMKLVLHERSGRFSLFIHDEARGGYRPLLFDGDPRTSVLTLIRDDQVYRMGESSGFSLSTEKTSQGAAFVWKSDFLELRQDFRFLRSDAGSMDPSRAVSARDDTARDASASPAPGDPAGGVEIRLTVTNTDSRDRKVGVRYLLDTQLGESSGIHFSTPLRERIASEASFRPTTEENSFLSADPRDGGGVGLQVLLRGGSASAVEEVVFANWKRLSETSWRYPVNPNRSFNLPPYSINDSAAGLYYPVEILQTGAAREIVTILRISGRGGFSGPSESGFGDFLSSLSAGPQGEGSRGDSLELLKKELARVEELLNRLNRRMDEPAPITEDENSTLTDILGELERSKSKHQ